MVGDTNDVGTGFHPVVTSDSNNKLQVTFLSESGATSTREVKASHQKGLLCTATGDVKVWCVNGHVQVIAMTEGQFYALAVKRVYTTGTTGTVMALITGGMG